MEVSDDDGAEGAVRDSRMAGCPRDARSDSMNPGAAYVTESSLTVPSIADEPAGAMQYYVVMQAVTDEQKQLLCDCCGWPAFSL
jgi:hypothetical protein